MVVICLCAVADRFHGYLRSVMLNVHPGVFLSMDLDAGTRQRVFETVEAWWNAEPRGSIVLIWKNPAEPSAIEIVNIGEMKRDVVEYDGIRLALHQMAFEAHQVASEAPGPSPRAPSAGAPPTDRSVQVIVEIEARAVTVERLFMISERQEWTFGETLEYALDAIELALAKTATG